MELGWRISMRSLNCSANVEKINSICEKASQLAVK